MHFELIYHEKFSRSRLYRKPEIIFVLNHYLFVIALHAIDKCILLYKALSLSKFVEISLKCGEILWHLNAFSEIYGLCKIDLDRWRLAIPGGRISSHRV